MHLSIIYYALEEKEEGSNTNLVGIIVYVCYWNKKLLNVTMKDDRYTQSQRLRSDRFLQN